MQNNNSTARLVKGFLATVIGAMLIIASYKIILKMVLFFGGVVLLRRGLLMLNSAEFERIVDGIKGTFNRIFS
ncbi:hypothetical protein FJ365_04145 [Candidatus Dependentiae bacterium]|nr:hypothetical protein [Candidatus Dependentiae bacterium]